MRLNSLSMRSFRNYQQAELEFAPGVNLIIGDNAQGKTNLLEAIAYLGSGKSFRAQKTMELIRFGADFGEISGSVFSEGREQSLRFLLFPGSRPRQIFRNGARKKALSDIAGVLPTVLFCPEDLMILKMGASQRRRFGDSGLCQLRPNYDAALTEYNRILDQKSRILKDHFENPGILEILPEFNTRLCQVGALLISYRARYYDALGKAAAVYHNQFSGGAEVFALQYKTVSTVTDPFAPVSVLTDNLLEHQQHHAKAHGAQKGKHLFHSFITSCFSRQTIRPAAKMPAQSDAAARHACSSVMHRPHSASAPSSKNTGCIGVEGPEITVNGLWHSCSSLGIVLLPTAQPVMNTTSMSGSRYSHAGSG